MTGGVKTVKHHAELDSWCWKDKETNFSNQELFSLARSLRSKSEINRDELKKSLMKARAEQSQDISEKTQKQLDDYIGKQLEGALTRIKGKENNGAQNRKPLKGKKREEGPGEDRDNVSNVLQKLARNILDEFSGGFSATGRNELQTTIKHVKHTEHLLEFIQKTEERLKPFQLEEKGVIPNKKERSSGRLEEEVPGTATREKSLSSPVPHSNKNESVSRDGFRRFPDNSDRRANFDGVHLWDSQEGSIARAGPENDFNDYTAFFDIARKLFSDYQRLKSKIHKHLPPEMSVDEIRKMIEQLIKFQVVSPTFSDAFLVNQSHTAYLLAKDAFLSMIELFSKRHPIRTGTHPSGSRGLQTAQLNKTQRARHLTTRLAPSHTLRRGLTRRTLYPSSYLLDEDDLIEYASRKKVGYSLVLAVDTSGAVQFGKRIQGVRRACMAFGYYLKRFHPYDRVRYIAYHEIAHEIRFSQLPSLKAINGAGKDIGGCLAKCKEILLHDPDRIPVIILIGDGLPVHGEKAGFYQFMKNNHDVIEKAYHNAYMLRKEGILFTFFQFREDRHLWEAYADETAQRITREARGILYRIDNPRDIASSLISTYDSFLTTDKLLLNKII